MSATHSSTLSLAAGGSEAGSASDPVVVFTPKAIEMLRAAMERERVPGYGVRVGVTGGGCSGFQYHMAFEQAPKAGDEVLEVEGIRIFIDDLGQRYLRGVTVDYVTGLHGAGFKFLNPNATRTCGCGSSFSA
jgi:iron-sulfur cluster assembly accessory protein